MDAKSVVVKGDRHVETLAGSDIILMHVDNGKFYTLSGTARRVWELMDGPLPIESLAERLLPEFAVERQACVSDLIALFRSLEANRLVDVASTASA